MFVDHVTENPHFIDDVIEIPNLIPNFIVPGPRVRDVTAIVDERGHTVFIEVLLWTPASATGNFKPLGAFHAGEERVRVTAIDLIMWNFEMERDRVRFQHHDGLVRVNDIKNCPCSYDILRRINDMRCPFAMLKPKWHHVVFMECCTQSNDW